MKDLIEIAGIMKGRSHPRCIALLMELKAAGVSLSLAELSEKAVVQYRTAAVHMSMLQGSGLVTKKRYGLRVEYSLTPIGENILEVMTCM